PSDDAALGKLKDLKLHVTVMLSKADNTWAKSTDWYEGTWQGTTFDVNFEVGDVDGDKRADIAMGGRELSPAVAVMLMGKGEKFEKVDIPVPGPDGDRATKSAIFADVTGDGRDDLVVYEDGVNIRVYSFDADKATFVPEPSWNIEDPIEPQETAASSIPAVTDLNGDGRDDLVRALWDDSSGDYEFSNKASVLLSGRDKFTAETWTMPDADQFEIKPPLRNAANNNGTGTT
ncbi:MAG: FG-GAP repeat domain-containing protein, partial [Nocardioides sp.]|uniref:FG-GAP repeat domain-containing protein n=1 Tax=Nocardioides sp. TaxID=35761 RepID=UPI003D6AB824